MRAPLNGAYPYRARSGLSGALLLLADLRLQTWRNEPDKTHALLMVLSARPRSACKTTGWAKNGA